jgi:hypothetical protein
LRNQVAHRRCMCCTARLEKPDSITEQYFWHQLPTTDRRMRPVDLCDSCWEEIRTNPAPKGALAPTEYRRGMEDGDDHCTVCGATYDGDAVGGDASEGWHTHQQCYEEGVSIGAMDADIENGAALAERIGVQCGYFDEVLASVPQNCSLGEWRPFIAELEEELEPDKACWVVWRGVVQVIPAYWFAEERAWLLHDHRLTEGVTHFMACSVPEAPRGG